MKIYSINGGQLFEDTESNTLACCLEKAVHQRAYLRGANLRGANLKGANLEGANLEGANLRGANLEGANLGWAILGGANLGWANLGGANLKGANLRGANLEGANLPNFLIVPEIGSFYAYKKLKEGVVVKVFIPSKAKRTNSLIGRKCRASELKVVKVVENPYGVELPIGSTNQGHYMQYQIGEIFKADSFDSDIRIECTHGIHFFMTLREAQEWN